LSKLKATGSQRNMIYKEFQQKQEYKMIWVMNNLKMLIRQFDEVLTLLRILQLKVTYNQRSKISRESQQKPECRSMSVTNMMKMKILQFDQVLILIHMSILKANDSQRNMIYGEFELSSKFGHLGHDRNI
jgi:hypothetical protein